MNDKKPIIIFGIPRSGSTWLSESLNYDKETFLVHEPDNEKHTFLAYIHKKNIGRFPYTDNNLDLLHIFKKSLKNDILQQHHFYNKLLFQLFNITKNEIENKLRDSEPLRHHLLMNLLYNSYPKCKLSRRVIVKSVHSFLSLPFLMKNIDFTPIIIIRNPLNILSSMLYLKMGDICRNVNKNYDIMNDFDLEDYDFTSQIAKAGQQIGIFYSIIEQYNKDIDNIILLKHEDLCVDYLKNFKQLYSKLNLNWNQNVENLLVKKNTRGLGYSTSRISHEMIDIWKKRLSKKQVEEFKKGYNCYPNNLYKID